MQTRIIRVSGKEELVSPANTESFTLRELQDIVGGFIEFIQFPDYVMIINEEGKVDNLQENVKATQMYQEKVPNGVIVGDVVVCDKSLID